MCFGCGSGDEVAEWPAPEGVLDDAALARLLASMAPGPGVMLALDCVDADGLDEGARLDVVLAWQRQLAWVAAKYRAALAAVHDAPVAACDLPEAGMAMPAMPAAEWRADEVAAVLRLSPFTASWSLAEASRLVNVFPEAHALLTAGLVSDRHVSVLLEETGELGEERARAVQERVLGKASAQTVARFARSVRRAVLAVAPDLAAAKRAKAKAERGVRLRPLPDGMAALSATLPAEDAQSVWEALDAEARKMLAEAKAAREAAPAAGEAGSGQGDVAEEAAVEGDGDAGPGEELRIGAARVDALVGWANNALADADLPRRHGRKAEVQVVIDLATLVGLAENPAELAGYGPIPAQAARELAADATWRRLVTDPVNGSLLDYGHTTYRPPQALADFLIARDRRCRFPGCTRRSENCDIDHVRPYDKGGPTAANNCVCLCRRHHRMKTAGHWKLRLDDDGAATWTSPNGETFVDPPHRQLE
jgi:hypothetical protein